MLCDLLLSHKHDSCVDAAQACASAHTSARPQAAGTARVPHLRVTRAPLKSAGCPGPYLPTLVDTTTLSRGRPRSPRPSSCAPGRRNHSKHCRIYHNTPVVRQAPELRAPAGTGQQNGARRPRSLSQCRR